MSKEILNDYACECGHVDEIFAERGEEVICPHCGCVMVVVPTVAHIAQHGPRGMKRFVRGLGGGRPD